ncbi:sporulation histidine kinase inhibitor Sda [Halalkalibacterium halodurans]|uniref:sporulation histidine kinase inhibitor Sda n=1 Tax=Halalkalibacterium halodurans TaxID=86665 RepID=UPI002AA99D58|nr:sporulation histidine kinase inhibitor Sda [Halalkalibacterium halodurans]MDY7221833.1 sporulation histidine kinase inhibitor Sda [Halalkalibacterium halodurans]MDY7241109.1 sporulation histidine kinase inhibitor Sda [Halalkalibacterium halodurans]MED4080541.1 sporulation histidine kinase inhibitor Sda [Halalkalibacterium halodurans]MED4083837.1 sporulation histidine kinase inhibitor Sda [Halalkalibacterium halodurans]MED4105474.1 sporulation histidine kinase inhibitor Sda [Halalkalibacteri
METLSDTFLMEACKYAIKLNLDPDFIHILIEECERRSLPIPENDLYLQGHAIDETLNQKELLANADSHGS